MRSSACLGKTALLLAVFCAPALHAEQGLLTFVFGPSSPEAARQSARASAATARHWVESDGGVVELRRSGSQEVQRIDAATAARDVDQKFSDAVLAARDADPASFLITLDSAAQAAATHSGTRVVVAVLNSPSFSSDGERTLEHLGEICQAHGVRVLVLDVAEGAKAIPNAALKALAAKSGGAWMRQAKDLGPQVAMVTPPDDESLPPTAPTPVQAAAKAAEATPSTPGAAPKSEIPVLIRFMRTAGTGSTSESITDHEADFGSTATLRSDSRAPGGIGVSAGGSGSMEVAFSPSDPNAPLQGLVTVESPLKALKFDMDDNTGTYQARARITAIVRNVKGAAIWSGRKDVYVHGPAQKLSERREGSMFFMRGLTVVGQGPFTLEAKVEDLLGHTTGMIQTPLRVGRNAPGLVATDAVAVRPFKASADKFEADQVLSYDGEALSPVLDPVYRSDQPVDLQIYLRLYPDIHSDPLRLSMEVLNEGRVVARMALPFKSGLANSAREGGMSGNSNVVGGQAKEFPYLVNLKGAKFPAGDYQGIISIQQGKNVIRRVVPFKVTGNGAAAPVETANGPRVSAAADDSETAAVVLPDIAPATIDSSGLKMRDEDLKHHWSVAGKIAMGYLDQLPNFRCIQETHRFTAPAKTPDQLKEADSYSDELIFEDGKERYQRLESNGVKADNTPIEKTGVHARNEFGSLLRGLFDPKLGATYHWAGRSMTLGVLCQVFEIEVSKATTNFVLHYGTLVEPVAYHGRVFIDDETGMVRRLTIEGTGLSKDFGLQSPSLSLDYGMVKIGEEDYLLPLRSVLQLRRAKVFIRNEAVFRGYRKFGAESHIKYDKDK
jgi:hypothetical protein